MSDDIPEQVCPSCRHTIDMAQAVATDEKLKPDDYVVCFYCAAPGIYEEGGTIRMATATEIADAPPIVHEVTMMIRDSLDAMLEDKRRRGQ